MQITSLGHTECLIDCPLSNGKNFRILLDSWLSDYSVADCMERSQKIQINWATFPSIDIVYISHSHLDHLDPYFLCELYKHQSPLLLLAETLAYLIPTITAYLSVGTRIELLRQLETRTFADEVELTGIIYCSDIISNEEDVMTLFVSHEKTCAYFEVDTVPPLIIEEQEKLLSLFTARDYSERFYFAGANELEGNLSILDCQNTLEREIFAQEYSKRRFEEIHENTAVILENDLPISNLWNLPGYEVLYIGQGLQFPSTVNKNLAATKIMSLEEVVKIENTVASKYNIIYPRRVLRAGETIGSTGNSERDFSFTSLISPCLDHTEIFIRKNAPVSLDIRDSELIEGEILYVLGAKFLPTKLADPLDNLKLLILDRADRLYIIAVDYTTDSGFERRYYAWGFEYSEFIRLENPPKREPDEIYFANDLADFLSGTQELYTCFIQAVDPSRPKRLWTVLGNTFLNHDLVTLKVAHHFELAREGVRCEKVLEYYRESL